MAIDPQGAKSFFAPCKCALSGLVITNRQSAVGDLESQKNGELLVLEFTNTRMLVGERKLWLKVETQDGRVLEMASVQVSMGLKSRTIAEFLLVSEKRAILNAKLKLG